MDSISIYRGTGTASGLPYTLPYDLGIGAQLVATIKPEDSSVQAKRVIGENELRLIFRMAYYTDFKINDHCSIFNETYKVNQLPQVIKRSKYLYEYNMTMQAEGFDLQKAQFLLFGQSDFPLTGNADTFMDLILENVARVSSGFTKGQVIPTEYKTITFKSDNCYTALARLATEFNTEFAIEGKVIHLTKRSRDTGRTLRLGRFKGLYEITRLNVDNSNLVTRLYAFGSDRNLPPDYRGSTSKRLKMISVLLDPGDYVELNTATYGVIEATQIFEDVYPHRTGTVSSVNGADIYKFTDTSIDFDINAQLLPGIAAKVTFNTGQMAGYTFDISAYDNSTKEVTILKNKDEKALDIPSSTLKTAIGDKYVLTDIIMPFTYLRAAERELKNKAIEAIAILSEPQVSYQLIPDPVYLGNNLISLNIGDLIWMVDAELSITRQIRITSTLRGIVQEFQYTVELSDVLIKGPITLLQNSTNIQGRQLTQITRQVNRLAENNLGSLPPIASPAGYFQVYMDSNGGLHRYP